MNILIIIYRTLFFYFLILIIYRIMGKREVGQLGIIDLIVSILIAELAVICIENYNKTMLYSIVPIIILTVLQIILAYISLKLPKIRNILDGKPSIIIKNGQVNYKEMIKQKYNLDDLLTQMRDKGYKSLEEIDYAILETNGTLSIFDKKQDRNLPLPLILDSNIEIDTLRLLNKDKKWIYDLLDKKNVLLDEVFYAFYKDKNIFIIKRGDLGE